ncbi:hypothetical protein LINPERPRIM_LOCUS14519 [Linum perenne]
MEMENICGCCGVEEETSEHLFFHCLVAMRCWELIGEDARIRTVRQLPGGIAAWVFDLIGGASSEKVRAYFTVIWAVWREQNERVWNRCSRPPEIVLRLGWEQVEEWRLSQSAMAEPQSRRRSKNA